MLASVSVKRRARSRRRPGARRRSVAGSPLWAADANPCPGDPRGADAEWTLSTTTFDPTFSRHPFVGNGYLGQVVPPAGMGYMATGEKTGWPLYTPRYDGAFVAGVYAQQAAAGREPAGDRGDPDLDDADPGRGKRDVLSVDARRPDHGFPADPLPALRPAADRADLDHRGRQVHRPRVRRPGRPRQRRTWPPCGSA